MFSSLTSQPLSRPLQKMEPVSNQDLSLLNMQTGITAPMSTNPASHFVVPNQQNTASCLVSNVSETGNIMVSDKQLMPNQKAGEMGTMRSNVGLQTALLPSKRKAAAEPFPNNSLPQQTLAPNKRMVQMEAHVNSPRLSPLSAQNKKHVQLQSVPNSQGSLGSSNKRMMRNESMPGKTGSPRVQTSKSKTAPTEVSPKIQSESYEAVRMKMRETLAAALSVGSQNKEEGPNKEVASSIPMQSHVNSQSASVEADAAPGSHVELKETPDNKQEDRGSAAGETAPEMNIQNLDQTGKSDGQKPQYNYVMPDTDSSFGDTFFVKDELLQGNGLSWAWDMEVAELKEVQTDEKSNSVSMDVGRYGTEQSQGAEREKLDDMGMSGSGIEQVISSPQDLAFKIEAELFKLFGGVNKKYKEKGRSLMFNLKDRNNPELREKVLSGKISPERLCSMTPEELASKELSEWRMAKAEELDKMIVLPDSDVDMRRLVKKTHKGEYQVEVEQDDGVSVEVSVGSSSLTQFRPKKKKTDHISSAAEEVKEKVVAEGDKAASEKLDATSSVTVSTDGTDFMQELIVDEFKDEGFLPPIVSLDEFMESLNTEPPFENLPVDGKETKLPSVKDNSETGGETGNGKATPGITSANPVETGARTNDGSNVKTTEVLSSAKRNGTSAERKLLPGEYLWEGDLQLTLSSAVSVVGLFRSGEKTSTKEWPDSMEIKGRVRLDAFEKFLQELPMSRSRAVMVVHFVLKDASSDIHRASLSEAVDSYVAEERVGFGEPIPGVELYFCPPNKRITEMLSRLLSKDQTDITKPTDNGLIGVVVWRRPHPTMLPNSSSHHKHHRKHLSSRRQENINANTNSKSLTFGHGQPPRDSRLPPQPNDGGGGGDDDDDDIPPGFGPGVVARDEDDLPEFSFSKGSNSSGQTLPAQSVFGSRTVPSNPPPRPVAQMRQLIYEYGQTGTNPAGSGAGAGAGAANWNGNRGSGIENRPWRQDEDDDIPEWQPQLQNRQQPPVPDHGVQELSRVHLVNQIRPAMDQTVTPVMPIRPPVNPLQNSWVQPPLPHGLPPNTAVPGQYYGGQWRHDEPRGRGF
ncbi:uncharacterized protein LOC112520879 isoform X1 [Cynara cardunculus var. scolymus]|uniref:uncharacterized protein LOC112520879 isoform X1 n=2 Tax=Cynara cardunculus var. scolymus TaxID=59895 RepID=UPI000D630D30|nr:uncharacterized protein LOC112520879 isoform X1 [Cynara cardunculus var. scolymus]XP_024985267.1 uncharacterized protein LOC112520879 isoform X1 [Cynara cardunculus var. scolymus]XP_024985268.1 uncharacterized protein LOC112520879 isoform X1 [Cynara cardunculus var. scolymus]